MSEFVNRMAAQRRALDVVNQCQWTEELFGLSDGAIRRWVNVNQISSASAEVQLVTAIADALNFLATRSQEQISSDYARVSEEVGALTTRLRTHFGERSLVG
jgi:hypothetical protein